MQSPLQSKMKWNFGVFHSHSRKYLELIPLSNPKLPGVLECGTHGVVLRNALRKTQVIFQAETQAKILSIELGPRVSKKPAVKPVMAVRPTKAKVPAPESGKVRLKSLFESLLRQARKADGGQPPENNTAAGILENAVGQLINNLISGTVDTDTFHEDLQKVLNSQPQPALVPFINENLQPLKISMSSGEISISGLGESKAAKPVMAVRPMKAVAKQRAVKPMRAPYALRNHLRVSAPKPRIIATPCRISQKSRKEKTKKGNSKFEGVCLLALTGTHDCSVDHDNENVPPQEQIAKRGNEDAKPRSLRDFRINRNKSKGTFKSIRRSFLYSGRRLHQSC